MPTVPEERPQTTHDDPLRLGSAGRWVFVQPLPGHREPEPEPELPPALPTPQVVPPDVPMTMHERIRHERRSRRANPLRR